MKSFLRFLRTTLVGGALFLVPIVALLIILGKALALAYKVVRPLEEHLPADSGLGIGTPVLLAVSALVLFCFFAGFFARTVFAQKMVLKLEEGALSSFPGYEFLKATSANLLGSESRTMHPVVLVRSNDAWQLAFLIERLGNGHVVVFVPGAPNPQAGEIYFMAADQVRSTNVPPTSALKLMKRMGVGSKALMEGREIDFATTGTPAAKPPPTSA